MKQILTFLLLAAAAGAQPYISPLAPPPFASDPATCYVGQLYVNTVTGLIKECTAANTWSTHVTGPTSSTNNNVPRWNGTSGGKLLDGLPVTQSLAVNSIVETNSNGTIGSDLVSGGTLQIPNDTGTGTTLTNLAKINSAGKALKTATTDTAVPIYIVVGGAGTSGNAQLAAFGTAICQFDASGVTVGNFVINSTTTAGRCADAGSAFPASGWVIGQALATAAANSTASVGLMYGDYAAASSGGSVTSIGFTTPTNGFTFTSSTTNPITTTGTITLGFQNENAGTAFIGPCTGAAAAPTWRVLCIQDLPGGVNTVTFSTTPTFDLSLGEVQTITLTSNVTSSTITNGVAGKAGGYTFIICQDGTGGRTFVWPATLHGTMTIGTSASLCSAQHFDPLTSSNLYAVGPGVINQ